MNFLEHHGVKGMKWGVRRYQNKDGTLTSAGKVHYAQLKEKRNVLKTSQAVEDEYDDVVKRLVRTVGDTPVAFLDIYDEIHRIHDSLSENEKYYLGDMSVSKYTTYAKTKNGAYITLDDYRGEYKDEHPYSGKIISIAASKESRGTGATDLLVKQAIKDNRGSRLIAEIDSDNSHSADLFKRNGFKLIDTSDDILYYAYETKKK